MITTMRDGEEYKVGPENVLSLKDGLKHCRVDALKVFLVVTFLALFIFFAVKFGNLKTGEGTEFISFDIYFSWTIVVSLILSGLLSLLTGRRLAYEKFKIEDGSIRFFWADQKKIKKTIHFSEMKRIKLIRKEGPAVLYYQRDGGSFESVVTLFIELDFEKVRSLEDFSRRMKIFFE